MPSLPDNVSELVLPRQSLCLTVNDDCYRWVSAINVMELSGCVSFVWRDFALSILLVQWLFFAAGAPLLLARSPLLSLDANFTHSLP